MGMVMTTNGAVSGPGLLRLMAWFSPSFPVGAFSYSHGLEFAVEAGLVTSRDTLVEWARATMVRGAGRVDAALVRAAHAATADSDQDELLWAVERGDAMQATRELAGESLGQGEAFAGALCAAWPHPQLDRLVELARAGRRRLAYPVAVGAAAAAHGLPPDIVLTAYLHALAANLVSAGVRLVPLGQTDGQRAIAALEPAVLDAVDAALARPHGDLGSAAPVIDWASTQHETQYTRLFRS